MERKAKLFSPLLIVAMVVSLVAGAVAIAVSPQQVSAQEGSEATVWVDAPDVVCICQNFDVTANVTNTGNQTLYDVIATIDIDGPASLVLGELAAKEVNGGIIFEGESEYVTWTLHCDAGGMGGGIGDTVNVTVTLDAGNPEFVQASGSESISLSQEPECLVDVKLYGLDGQPLPLVPVEKVGYAYVFDACDYFYVDATVTNATGEMVGNVTANITYGSDIRLATELGETGSWKTIGDINSKEVGDAWWLMHCDDPGQSWITVKAYVDGEPWCWSDPRDDGECCEDTVTVIQTTPSVLEIEIVEPDDLTEFCLSQWFVVKAHITNIHSWRSVSDVRVSIYRDPEDTTYLDDPYQYNLQGDMLPGDWSSVAWMLHCEGPGETDITVNATAYDNTYHRSLYDEEIAEDTITIFQLATGADPSVFFTEPVVTVAPVIGVTGLDSADLCADCDTVFPITAVIMNNGCNTLTNLNAILVLPSGWQYHMAVVQPLSQFIGDIGPQGSALVTWDAMCLGPGAIMGVDVQVYGTDLGTGLPVGPVSALVPIDIYQRQLMVDITVPDLADGGARFTADYDGNPYTVDPAYVVSICQEFEVVTTVTNCSEDEINDIDVTLTLPPGTEVAGGGLVTIDYPQQVGTPTETKSVQVSWDEYGVYATVNIEGICGCCDAVITWTLHCVDSTTPDGGPIMVQATVVPEDGSLSVTDGSVTTTRAGMGSFGDHNGTISASLEGTTGSPVPAGVYCVNAEYAILYDGGCYNNTFAGMAVVDVTGNIILSGAVTINASSVCNLQNGTFVVDSGSLSVSDGAISGSISVDSGNWTMTFTSGTFLSCDTAATAPLIQECKAHLMAGMETFPGTFSDGTFSTSASHTFSVCQDFTLVVAVTNVGEATATDVAVTISLVGDAELVSPTTLTQTIGTIPGRSSGKAIWELHCTAVGDVTIAISALTGNDLNTGQAIHADNIDYTCFLAIEQVEAELVVEIIQPPPPDPITVCQEFAVKALITNTGTSAITGVFAYIDWTPSSGASFVSGFGTVQAKLTPHSGNYPGGMTVGPGSTVEVQWTLHCDEPGPLTITVYAAATVLVSPLIYDAFDSVTVEQLGIPDIEVDILSPRSGETPIATSQEFAITAVVRNTGNLTALGVTATIGDQEGCFGTGNGVQTTWGLDERCITPGTEMIWVKGVLQTSGVDYTMNYPMGLITFTTPPVSGATLDAAYLHYLSLVDSEQTQALGDIAPLGFKIVTWTLHADTTCSYVDDEDESAWLNVWASATNMPCNPFGSLPGFVQCPRDDIRIVIYPAAHLVVNITSPADGAEITVCQEFDVVATVQNTGQADAWEVEAALSVQPESSARLALSGDDARAGYTKYIGTLVGWGVEESATLTWTMHCKEACNATITVTATGRDELGYFVAQILGGNWSPVDVPDPHTPFGYETEWADEGYDDDCFPGIAIPSWLIEPDSITVKQVDPAMLVVESLISPAQVEVCQDFTVSAVVKNVGGSSATSVEATLDLTGLDASLTAGSLINSLGDIEAGSLEVANWQLHCDGAGSGVIAVTADAANTSAAMAASGVLQVVPAAAICLAVEIDAPAEVTVEQAYFVTAVVTNLCGVEACDVTATITISGEAELASGETAAKDLGCIDPGDSKAVDWEVDCTDVGGVNVSVSASATGTNTAIDSVAVRQAEYLDWSEVLGQSLEDVNAALESIDGNVATMSSDVGTIKTDVAGINLTVTSIDDGVATIVTDLGALNGTVTDISDDVATITTDLGVVKADVSGIADATDTLKSRSIWTLPILILVAIGAIAVIIGVAIVASRKRPVPVVIERKEE